MKESNIYFATNTYNYGGECIEPTRNKFDATKGNIEFFRQVMDYDALMKLRSSKYMKGTLNAKYYVANIAQIRVLDPNFSSAMIGRHEVDPEIEAKNRRCDAEYGYPEKNHFHPLLGEIVLDPAGLTYADELLGKWEKASQGLEDSEGDAYGLYLKQRIEKNRSKYTVKPQDAGLKDIQDQDPYYYNYRKVAASTTERQKEPDKTRLYKEKYGSIFRAFSEVEQDTIITAPVNQWSFVNAGPGTGKTYTLMKKITYMIENLDVDPEGILVLCFTNAAVNEIKSRIKKYAIEEGDRSFINVDVRTFHSFSWLLISQANEVFHDRPNYQYIDITKLNYDQSIREATGIIRKFGDEVFGLCNHLIVDEIQDLTDERAGLVIAMVDECMKNGVGVTLLGDSCQAIYDYAEENEKFFEMKSNQFYEEMFAKFYEKGEFYKLEKNHRQSDKLIKLTAPLRQSILSGKSTKVRETIKVLSENVPDLTVGKMSLEFLKSQFQKLTQNEKVCLLCRNNAQVLATSSNLWKRGIKHIVNAYNEFEYLSDWIGKVFCLFTKEIITIEEFSKIARIEKLYIDSEQIWERLQELIGSENNVLHVKDILRAVAQSRVDDPIFRNVPDGNLIVSNIHKAKGREYDEVVVEKLFVRRLIDEGRKKGEGISEEEYLQEAKVLYVAVTRPKTKVYFNWLASANVSLKEIKATGRKRWVRGDGNNLKTIEIRALSDVDIDSFNRPEIQDYIIRHVHNGDEVKLVQNNDNRTVGYNVVHISTFGEHVIAKATMDFVDDVDAIITPYESPWPRRIENLYVSGVHTQISKDYKNAWCWVDFCGLGTAYTDVY